MVGPKFPKGASNSLRDCAIIHDAVISWEMYIQIRECRPIRVQAGDISYLDPFHKQVTSFTNYITVSMRQAWKGSRFRMLKCKYTDTNRYVVTY